MNKNLVSVIIPTYKRHKEMVKRAIESVLNQTYKCLEVILVDDNALDNLSEFRKEILDLVESINDSRIKLVLNKDNLGGAESRNVGVNESRGCYISFLDDDDIYLPDKILNQINFIVNNDYDMIFTNLCIYNEKDELIDVRKHNINSFDKQYLLKYHLTKQITGTPTFMIKRDVFLKINGFDNVPMGQEYYLMFKIIESGAKIGYLNVCDIKAYRYDIEAISTGKNKIIGEKKLYAFKKNNFKYLSKKERRFVKFRHYVVMAIAYKRNKMYIKAMFTIFYAFLISPYFAFNEFIGLQKRKKEVHNHE